jgi:6-phosphogluconolactonase
MLDEFAANTASYGESQSVPEIYIADANGLALRLADELTAKAPEAIARRGIFSLALPGGSVATSCFPALANLPLPWRDVHFFWADERAVPASDPESNAGLADRLWLTPARVPAASIHRMPADATDLTAAADAYTSELTHVLGADAVLDLALLGMGPDGHIASLFPGHPLLAERERLVAPVIDSPKPPPRRLTLTMPVLAKARRVIVVAFGSSKAQVLAQALDVESALPVAQVLRLAGSSLVLADEAAGARLG